MPWSCLLCAQTPLPVVKVQTITQLLNGIKDYAAAKEHCHVLILLSRFADYF